MKNFTEKVKELAMSLGAGIVGIASMERLERITPTGKVPSNLLEDGRSVVVYGVPLLRGAIRSEDLRLKRYNAVEACKKCDEISFNLAQYLERNGYDSLIIHADVPVDFEKDSMLGDLSLRHVAAEAGLGEVGLSTNFISPEYGPRVYLGAVLTTAALVCGEKKDQVLCDRGKCSLCIDACPVKAISRDGTKNHQLCLPEAMPFGLRNILRHFNKIIRENDPKKQGDLIYSLDTFNAWQSILTKMGVFGGCFRCMEVCPVAKRI